MNALGIDVSDLEVWRDDGLDGEPRSVLKNVAFSLAAGKCAAVIGVSGSGKTSLLLALVGAVPFRGRIAFGDSVLEKKTLETLRRKIGFVFAEPADQLFLPTVFDEVAFAPRQRGLGDGDVRTRVQRSLALVGLEGFEQRAPTALSLGEQRRLALATALSGEPSVLILDEPTSSLDARARRSLISALKQTDATLLVATHDLELAIALDADVVLLARGGVHATGPAEVLLRNTTLCDRAGLDAV